ncbi:hypothetical protein L249_3399 [Ophiocordyceps polyrhachis-furcata BCC 54312]|uniref:Uncharacterized protein n=1 Tax=Ophiocordyceps polyrhachis-furcata BCC 54312 TaxID=1330021 RepID=A0A367LM58_9HYPO|nr:hypothetical protein L249_3399 [Ophiocordyceps polyrhachis-furcata BCC 54312]
MFVDLVFLAHSSSFQGGVSRPFYAVRLLLSLEFGVDKMAAESHDHRQRESGEKGEMGNGESRRIKKKEKRGRRGLKGSKKPSLSLNMEGVLDRRRQPVVVCTLIPTTLAETLQLKATKRPEILHTVVLLLASLPHTVILIPTPSPKEGLHRARGTGLESGLLLSYCAVFRGAYCTVSRGTPVGRLPL